MTRSGLDLALSVLLLHTNSHTNSKRRLAPIPTPVFPYPLPLSSAVKLPCKLPFSSFSLVMLLFLLFPPPVPSSYPPMSQSNLSHLSPSLSSLPHSSPCISSISLYCLSPLLYPLSPIQLVALNAGSCWSVHKAVLQTLNPTLWLLNPLFPPLPPLIVPEIRLPARPYLLRGMYLELNGN